jgi:cytochrome c oxidase subunit II
VNQWLPFWPTNAAESATVVDTIVFGELGLTVLILCFVFGMVILFCARYRADSRATRVAVGSKSWRIEIGWTSITLAGFFVLFAFGAHAYLFLYRPPARADLELYVIGKQWMWKIQHPGGQREIDAMHVPIHRTVRVILASHDVIHSLFLPEFRVKHDAVPGQFETFWFRPTRLGTYQLECSEFCGTEHAHMIGSVTVMTESDYARWLQDQGVSDSLSQRGAALFRAKGCSSCHSAASTIHAPSLDGLYGSIVHLSDGRAVRADERYIRDCMLLPENERVAGYPPAMPSFAGQLSEEDLIALLAYIKSLPAEGSP